VGIAVDGQGKAYVAGNTNTTDLPTTNGVLSPKGIGAFVAKVNSDGTSLAHLTYPGSTDYLMGAAVLPANVLDAIEVDGAGNLYLERRDQRSTISGDGGAYQTSYGGAPASDGNVPLTNAFAAKLAPDGRTMIWATYVGGTGTDTAQSVAVDKNGNASEWRFVAAKRTNVGPLPHQVPLGNQQFDCLPWATLVRGRAWSNLAAGATA